MVSTHGRHGVVETAEGTRLLCHPRGKRLDVVVGDRVRWRPSHDEGVIEQVQARRNLLYRQDAWRSKSFAANLGQVLVLLAAEPDFSEQLLARALIACAETGIAPLIALNKADLHTPFARAWQRLQAYRDMGLEVLPLAAGVGAGTPLALPPGCASGPTSAEQLMAPLMQRLDGRTTLVLGPSGSGKSTLINRLVPEAEAATAEISQALNAGRHTTTHTQLYWLDTQRRSALIDSPGFQEFGLHHIDPAALAGLMPDLAAHTGRCRFHNCSHLHEPGCPVRAAAQAEPPAISPSRWRIYAELAEELRRAGSLP